ncbi:MAG: gliding motility-associated C-terminal domain-containing protein [Bacteroidetes bacterium]|nr:gliding motility-associated C-terminal domain-containing protein [Bacteroidota bacterium]
MKKGKNIEQLYRENFNDFRVEPSSGLWKKISSKLAWKSFFSFNPSTFNAYYLSAILAIATTGVLLITKPVTESNREINEISINETIEIPAIVNVQEERRKAEGGRRKAEGSGQKAVGSWQLEEGISEKQEVNNQKTDSCINDRSPSTQQLATSTQKTDSGTNYQTPRTQQLAPSTREPVTHIVSRNKTKINISRLATPHPKPKTQNPPSTQYPAPSTDLPDPWPNIDSLFTNQTPTPPQHSIQFPNAFIPNPNGPANGYYTPGIPNNNVFHPVYKGVVEYHLSIFNRRGELIFESNDINIGWDGYINDRLAAQGVYIWKVRGRYSNGQSFIKFGNVMLIKK